MKGIGTFIRPRRPGLGLLIDWVVDMAPPKTPNAKRGTMHGAAYAPDVQMGTHKNWSMSPADVTMASVRGANSNAGGMNTVYMDNTTMRGPGLKLLEKALVESPEVRRKATVAQLCPFLSRALLRC